MDKDTEFDCLLDAIRIALRKQPITARVSHTAQPPQALFHTTLDGKEYLVAILPTDLVNESDALAEEVVRQVREHRGE